MGILPGVAAPVVGMPAPRGLSHDPTRVDLLRMTMMLDPAGAARVRHRPVPSLPPTEALLVAGGDARLDIDPSSGTNRYFCSPSPVAALAAFGSATASIVSP